MKNITETLARPYPERQQSNTAALSRQIMDTIKIAKYVITDIIRNRFVMVYTALLLVLSMSFFNLEDEPAKGIMSLLNVVLIVLPLVSIVFATIHMYNAVEFTELLLAQPIQRQSIVMGQYIGIGGALCLAYLIGVGIPIFLFDGSMSGAVLLVSGLLLTLVFVAMAVLATVVTRDKARGIGLALAFWFYFSILYDGLVLMIMFSLNDYPLEKAVIGLSFLNPVDLARIAMLMQLDAAALMGYTGAIFQQFFGSAPGMVLSAFALLSWALIPLGIAVRVFKTKDI